MCLDFRLTAVAASTALEEPELLFGSESVDAADETARQLDDQFAETEKHAKV